MEYIENFLAYLNNNKNEITLKYKFYIDNCINEFNEIYEINHIKEINDGNLEIIELNTNKFEFELFGKIFVDINKDNCILIINENIIRLRQNIKISEIFECSNQKRIEYPIHLKVQLIEKLNIKITDFSFMFFGISTL